ncbi:hypothetical protein O181_000691 [Austropuccinia psidii MF-1]|uniref:Cytochrome c oxidase assembly factor 5 n=1 Tax=Austropuccinia psidii MF-1 TaxID=1389203 RepID=A0A9Q3GBS9_9BASI|nr:hypothetical protein [Austropuccinia psidii MF-1]
MSPARSPQPRQHVGDRRRPWRSSLYSARWVGISKVSMSAQSMNTPSPSSDSSDELDILLNSSTLPAGRCSQIKADLTNCILRSDCVLKPPHHTPKECLQSYLHELPTECVHLRYAFFNCKRGLLDMRKRFRGLDPSQNAPPHLIPADQRLLLSG